LPQDTSTNSAVAHKPHDTPYYMNFDVYTTVNNESVKYVVINFKSSARRSRVLGDTVLCWHHWRQHWEDNTSTHGRRPHEGERGHLPSPGKCV